MQDLTLELNKNLHAANTSAEKTNLQRQIGKLVCELYGLTDEEIRIVEEATK